MTVICRTCGVPLEDGEAAYASDWTVITEDGPHMGTRYQHIACGDDTT